MAKAKHFDSLSGHFGIAPADLKRLGVANVTLAIDTKLFIDPVLLAESSHPEMRDSATQLYQRHFQRVITFLGRSQKVGDVAWRTADGLLKFPEVSATCLGYGAGSIRGRGWGPALRARIMQTGKDIVSLGIDDPDLFASMALFEEEMGPDKISDMTTNIVLPALASFNKRILRKLGLKGEQFIYRNVKGEFLRNPFQDGAAIPIVLVPTDILRELPVVNDWSGVSRASSENALLRKRVNDDIASIWQKQTREEKRRLREQALASRRAFETLLASTRAVKAKAYDADRDPHGLLDWAVIAQMYAHQYPLSVAKPRATGIEEVFRVVKKIVDHFRQLVEHEGLNKELYDHGRKPRHESSAQRIFAAIASSYCVSNNIDISPEIDTGTGKIDFKFSKSFDSRVLVEVKLSTNSKAPQGYVAQIEEYKKAQQTTRAFYLLLDVGGMGRKDELITAARNEARSKGRPLSEFELIDATLKAPPSKRKASLFHETD